MIWNDENVELLKKMYAQGAKCSDIASALNTTTRSVRNKAWKLGITHNDNYTEEEKEQQERIRISHLHCTKRVLALILQQLGVHYSRLKALIDSNEQAQLEWDLCVELERSNPLLDILGAELGISSKTIDKIFKYANGEIGKEDFDETDIVKGGAVNG